MWFGYLVYSLDNCAIKLCIETGLSVGLPQNTPVIASQLYGVDAKDCVLVTEAFVDGHLGPPVLGWSSNLSWLFLTYSCRLQ